LYQVLFLKALDLSFMRPCFVGENTVSRSFLSYHTQRIQLPHSTHKAETNIFRRKEIY
jgi:hypothetical protein